MAKKQDTKNPKRKTSSRGPANVKKHRLKKQAPRVAPLVEAEVSDSDISEEDLDFVGRNAHSLGFLATLDKEALDKQLTGGKVPNDRRRVKLAVEKEAEAQAALSEDSGGEEYEKQPRQAQKQAEEKGAQLLPFKTPTGELVYAKEAAGSRAPLAKVPAIPGVQIEDGIDHDSDVEDSPVVSEDEEASSAGDVEEELEEHYTRHRTPEKTELQEFMLSEERREELKQQIAVASTQLLQDPEAHVANLRTLLGLAGDRDVQVAKWAMLSLVAVFKDILPGYQIRPPTEKELAMPISKEVKKLREHESALLKAYQTFLKGLLAAAGGQRGMGFARAAVKSLCMLLPSRFTFNYASDLLQAVVPRMAHRDCEISALCCTAVKAVLERDVAGTAASEAVQLIADLVKRKKCACAPDVVSILLSLKLSEAEGANIKAEGKARRIGGSKKPPKRRKKQKDEVAADFEEASVRPDAHALRQAQSDMLEVLFEIFFRVLKQTAASGLAAPNYQGPPISEKHAAKKFPLMRPALQGLVRFSHMLSVEYFADIMEALLGLARAPGLPLQVRLTCLLCTSDIHKAQGEALTIERRSLYEALFEILVPSSLGLLLDDDSQQQGTDPTQTSDARNGHTAATPPQNTTSKAPQGAGLEGEGTARSAELPMGVLLTRLATQMLLDQGRGLETARLAAFVKRLAGVALLLEPGAGMGLLAVVDRMLRRNQKLRGLLEHEGGPAPPSGGPSDDGSLEAAAHQSKGSTLWELSLCSRHMHPHMAQAAASVAAIPIEGSAGLSHAFLSSSSGPEGVSAAYSTSKSGGLPDFTRSPEHRSRSHVPRIGAKRAQ